MESKKRINRSKLDYCGFIVLVNLSRIRDHFKYCR